jgi:hypothetical protein
MYFKAVQFITDSSNMQVVIFSSSSRYSDVIGCGMKFTINQSIKAFISHGILESEIPVGP